MAKGDRPVVRIVGKRKRDAAPELPEYLNIASFWVSDDGAGLSGRWDRDIVKIQVSMKDGTCVTVSDLNGLYFCNLQDNREGQQRAGRPAPNPVRRQRREEPPDFGVDDYKDEVSHSDDSDPLF